MKKIGDSFKGIAGGFILIIISVILLWWNEGNNVRNLKTTSEMDKTYIDISSDSINPANEGKLIATFGKLINEEEIFDDLFDVKIVSPVLKRVVEVYQWKENVENEDDQEVYNYTKVWSSELIDSSSFNESNHINPTTKPYEDKTFTASNVKVGAFNLSSDQINNLSTKGVIEEFNIDKITELGYTTYSNYLTNATDFNNPNIGDVRIFFEYNNSTDISVLAVQSGNTFTDFVSSSEKRINRIMDGIHSGSEMIDVIKKENKILKWVLRLVGVLLCVGGVSAILKPISTITSFVPILGGAVGAVVFVISLLCGLSISLLVIAIAWIRFRPLIGLCLLAIVGALVFLLIKKLKKNKNNQQTTVVNEDATINAINPIAAQTVDNQISSSEVTPTNNQASLNIQEVNNESIESQNNNQNM